MTPVIIIPWRGGDPHREKAFDYVTKWIDQTGITRVWADSGADPFCRAESKNFGASEETWADVLIFNDADMIIPVDTYHELARLAWDTGNLCIGFVEYCALDQYHAARIYAGDVVPFSVRHPVNNVGFSLGGVIAIRRDSFEEIGGYDERFRAWGNEDFALAIAAGTLFGNPLPRIEGQALHFFHEHATLYVDEDQLRANAELLTRYNQIENAVDLRKVQGLP